MALSVLSASVLVATPEDNNYLVILESSALGLLTYTTVLFITGNIGRFVPTMSSIIACGSILTFLFVIEYVLFRPFLGQRIAGIIATLIILWSVPVEGHIIARAIGRHWFIGIVIAMSVFVLQLGFQSMISPAR